MKIFPHSHVDFRTRLNAEIYKRIVLAERLSQFDEARITDCIRLMTGGRVKPFVFKKEIHRFCSR
jgi:hypothetical protein